MPSDFSNKLAPLLASLVAQGVSFDWHDRTAAVLSPEELGAGSVLTLRWDSVDPDLDKAGFLAAKVQFQLDSAVRVVAFGPRAVTLVLGAPASPGLPTVSAWFAKMGQLGEPAPPAREVLVDSGEPVPSKVARPGFVWAHPLGFRSTSRTGKWCVTGDAGRIDQLWAQVRHAIQDKTLVAGCASTAAQAAGHGGSFVVCAFTRDWLDFEDLRATRELLRSWGVSEEIGYKRDVETVRNVYSGPDEWIYRA